MAANVEEFLLKLNQQISGPASVAQSALNALEAQIRAEQSALVTLQAKATAAGQAVGAQSAFVKDLQAQLGAPGLDGKQFAALAKQADGAAKKLRELQKAQDATKGAVADKGANIGKLQAAVAPMKIKADKGNVEAAAKKAADALKESGLNKLKEAAEGANGPLGKVAQGLGKIKEAGAAGAAVAIVVALIAVAAAAIAAAIALTRFALASADAARSSRLMSNAAAGGSAVGAELEAVISDIASKSPLARDKIAEMGRAMELARLQGRNMQNALEAAATASSAIGDSAGAALTSIATNSQNARRFMLTRNDFTGVSAELEGTGLAFADVAASIAAAQGISIARASQLIKAGQISVKAGLEAMNDAVQKKFGKTVAAQMLSVTTQIAKMKEGFAGLFKGVDIEPFLRGLKLITGLFSEQTVTGMALKTLFTSIFNPLAAASEGIFPIISAFLRGMVIAVLASYLAFLKVKKAISEAFGGDSTSKIDWIKVAMYAGIIAVVAMGAAMFALVAIVALVIAVFVPLAIVMALPFIIPLLAIGLLIYGIYSLYEAIASIQIPDLGIESAFKAALAFIESISLAEAAGHIMDSLANGITAKIASVTAAMKSVGSAILGALPAVLQMHSPSVLLTNQAKMAAGSVVTPIEDAKEDAHAAMADLGGGRPDFAPTTGAPAKGGGGGRVFNFHDGAIRFEGSRADIPTFMQQLRDAIEQLENEGAEPNT